MFNFQESPLGAKMPRTTTEKKNALIDAMQVRVKGNCTLNANEILASAGINNHRVNNQVK